MTNPNDEEVWTLSTERIAQVLADVRKTPCPRSACCMDDVDRVRFALHIIAEKALAELLEYRTASAPHVNAALATIGPLMTQEEAEQHRAERAADRDDPADDAGRARRVVRDVAYAEITNDGALPGDTKRAERIADRVAAQLTAPARPATTPPPTPARRLEIKALCDAWAELDGAVTSSLARAGLELLARVAELERQLTFVPTLTADEIKQLRHHIAGHRATCGYSCSLIERLLSQVTAPPGHVCPAPYGLGPEDLDALEDLSRTVLLAGATRTRKVLDRIIAMHRPPLTAPALASPT